MSDLKFGLWTVPESPVTIEYSLVVIEEIRREVAEGYQRLSRGGIEVGGALYGTRDGRTVRIMAMRPVACEHARGPGFIFSDRDRAALHEQLLRDQEDPHLEGLISVGWFLSHTRSEILLSETDQEIFSIFFPAPWQVTMVVRPGRGGSMRAGFFVRSEEGVVQAERSPQEFNFPDRLAGLPDRTPERPSRERERGLRNAHPAPSFYRAEAVAPAPAPERPEMPAAEEFEIPGPQLLRPPPPRRKWPVLLAWAAVVLVAAVLGVRFWMTGAPPEPIGLQVLEHDGQLQIQWNHAAKPVASATAGALEITDGTEPRTTKLTRQDLAAGQFTFLRKTGEVTVRMTVQNPNGGRTEEASRFLGPPPAPPQTPQESAEVQKERQDLEAEVQRLRQANGAQAARIQQLERTIRILSTRLGIVDPGKQ